MRTTGVAEPIHYNVGDVVKIFGRPEMETSHDNCANTFFCSMCSIHTNDVHACKKQFADEILITTTITD